MKEMLLVSRPCVFGLMGSAEVLSYLEEAIAGGPLQLCVDVGQVVEGCVPGQVLHLLVEVAHHRQGDFVTQHPSAGQVQSVVNQLRYRGTEVRRVTDVVWHSQQSDDVIDKHPAV